ncbi:hypothetical protein LJC10_04055 [Selenomonadales bacterium OttesenSCG-928-I06]|nr:hypothetical protein [Selenomonadales bacterium OttesenSCG-928-I06]
MENRYPHWYGQDTKMMPCCDHSEKEIMCCEDPCSEPVPHKMYYDTFKERLMCFLGDEVLIGTDSNLYSKTATFCGTICYVGCDYIIVNSCYRHRTISLHVPICAIRYIAPYKGRR